MPRHVAVVATREAELESISRCWLLGKHCFSLLGCLPDPLSSPSYRCLEWGSQSSSISEEEEEQAAWSIERLGEELVHCGNLSLLVQKSVVLVSFYGRNLDLS